MGEQAKPRRAALSYRQREVMKKAPDDWSNLPCGMGTDNERDSRMDRLLMRQHEEAAAMADWFDQLREERRASYKREWNRFAAIMVAWVGCILLAFVLAAASAASA